MICDWVTTCLNVMRRMEGIKVGNTWELRLLLCTCACLVGLVVCVGRCYVCWKIRRWGPASPLTGRWPPNDACKAPAQHQHQDITGNRQSGDRRAGGASCGQKPETPAHTHARMHILSRYCSSLDLHGSKLNRSIMSLLETCEAMKVHQAL
jgi:hypothetical protein